MDPVQGTLVVQEPLSHTSAAVVILTFQVVDKNADDIIWPTEEGEEPINKQVDTGETSKFSEEPGGTPGFCDFPNGIFINLERASISIRRSTNFM